MPKCFVIFGKVAMAAVGLALPKPGQALGHPSSSHLQRKIRAMVRSGWAIARPNAGDSPVVSASPGIRPNQPRTRGRGRDRLLPGLS